MTLRAIALLVVVLSVGCTTRLTLGAEKVRVTREPKDVANCKSLGFFDAKPPFSTPKDAENEMRNKTEIFGGDTLLITNYGMKATGVAYACTRRN